MRKHTDIGNEEKKQFWQTHVDQWKESNLSQKKYCESNAVSYWNFRTWHRRLQRISETPPKYFVKLQPEHVTPSPLGKIEIRIHDTITISAEENISECDLKKIFSALGYYHD